MSDDTPSRPAHTLPNLATGHTVRGYDRDLNRLRALILEMGERTVEQLKSAVSALLGGDTTAAYRVLDREPQIDYLALDADEEAFEVIVRRAPKAVDLRIVIALAKIADEAERAADKAARIAHRAIVLSEGATRLHDTVCERLRLLHDKVCCTLERAMEAVATFDTRGAVGVFEDETALDETNRDLVGLLTAAGEHTPPLPDLEALFAIAHALRRIGKHAAAIAEHVVYVALGQDVRFRNREILIETLKHRDAGA